MNERRVMKNWMCPPDFRCHPRIRLRDTAPVVFSAREENLATEEVGSVYLAVVRSDVLESVRTARELLQKSAGCS